MEFIAKKRKVFEGSSRRYSSASGRSTLGKSVESILPPGKDLYQRKPFCSCDGGCPVCTDSIQPKLKIGSPNDKYEQEADRVADQIMRMPDPTVQRAPT